ncbi:hypothetical protein IY145_22085 [Methylosinus sp. H3A]|uniref:hypothetical protein n=1 Tax=Methylosinus sp. H3A TaxID=2785786 RepID=UPI0018C2C459|nr:hypothetical protein [Methylosinus sp. H3A]MBG0812035.1 hypothetical protein [Methylosinus sp. H3A]
MSVIERSAVVACEEPEPLLRALSSSWLCAALVLVAIVQQIVGHIDCDVSWFLTFAEKVLDGRAAYVEVSDPNPPAAFLSLMPAVLLARASHLPPEAVLAALVFAFAAGSIGFSFYLLRRGAARSRRTWMLLLDAAIFLLLVAPEIVFAEREHIALLAVLPLLAALAVEDQRAPPPRWARILAGLGGGVAVALKPHFVLAIALPALAIAWRERSLRILWREELVSAALAAVGLTGATLIAFPAYPTQALPLALEVYARARDDLGHFLAHTLALVYVALLAGFLVAARGVPLGRATLVALFSSLGFFAAFLLQGKGWMNHAFPALALLLFAWTFLALRDRMARVAPPTGTKLALMKFLFLPGLLAAPAYFGVVEQLTDHEEHPGLLDAVAFVAPPHPRVATIASQLDYGHPLVRQLDGEWVGRQNALWTTAAVGRLLTSADPRERERLEARRSADLAGLAADIREGRPDIVVVEDRATREWVLRRPEMAGALDAYRLAKQAGDIEIWRRAE